MTAPIYFIIRILRVRVILHRDKTMVSEYANIFFQMDIFPLEYPVNRIIVYFVRCAVCAVQTDIVVAHFCRRDHPVR